MAEARFPKYIHFTQQDIDNIATIREVYADVAENDTVAIRFALDMAADSARMRAGRAPLPTRDPMGVGSDGGGNGVRGES